MNQYQGLLKLAQSKPWFGQMLDAQDRIEGSGTAGKVVKVINRALNPLSYVTNNKALDTYQNFQQKHPLLNLGASFVPVVGAAPSAVSAANNMRNGNYGSAAADAAVAVISFFGGGLAAKTLQGASRLARGVKLTKAVTKAGPVARTLSKIPGAAAVGKGLTATGNQIAKAGPAHLMSHIPGIGNMSAQTQARLRAFGMQNSRMMPGSVAAPLGISAMLTPSLFDPKPTPGFTGQYADRLPEALARPAAAVADAAYAKYGEAARLACYGLTASDLTGMVKLSQDSFLGGAAAGPSLVSLGDIYDAINADHQLTYLEREQLIKVIKAQAGGRSEATAVSSLMSGALGAILGQLMAKYFRRGAIGQALGAMLGFGAGRSIYSAMTAPKDPTPGYRRLG